MIKGPVTGIIYSIQSPLYQGLQACPSRPKNSSDISTSSPNQPPSASSLKPTPNTSTSSPTTPPNCAAPSPTWPPASTSPTGASSSSSPPWNAPAAGGRAATAISATGSITAADSVPTRRGSASASAGHWSGFRASTPRSATGRSAIPKCGPSPGWRHRRPTRCCWRSRRAAARRSSRAWSGPTNGSAGTTADAPAARSGEA